MSPLAKGLVLLFGVPVVLGGIFFTYFSATGEERMRGVCQQIPSGMRFSELTTLAQNYNFAAPLEQSGVYLLHDARSYGRHTCKIVLEQGTVQSATYNFAD